jgi:DDE superfamily endonuclease
MVLRGPRCWGGIMLVGQAPEDLICTWTQALQKLIDRIGVHFQRPEPRRRVGRFVAGLLGGVERCNGWQLAEHAGEATPDGIQRLLYQAKWDPDAVCADVADYVGEHLGEPSAVLVVDDSGMPKKGTRSAGVAPQYCGARNTVVNCQVGVFVAYVSRLGTALVERELYLPKAWTDDRERCRGAGIPDHVGLRASSSLRCGCWSGWWGGCRPPGWPRTRCMARIPGWRAAGWGMCSVSGRSTESPSSLARVTWSSSRPAILPDASRGPAGCGSAQAQACRGRAGGTGPAWSCRNPPCTATPAGCWSDATHKTSPSWPSSSALAHPAPPGVLARVEGARWGVEEALQTAKAIRGWTITRSAATTPGTGT